MLDRAIVENQSILYNKFYDDSYHVNTNQNFDCEDALEGFGVFLEFGIDGMCECKSNYSFEL